MQSLENLCLNVVSYKQLKLIYSLYNMTINPITYHFVNSISNIILKNKKIKLFNHSCYLYIIN